MSPLKITRVERVAATANWAFVVALFGESWVPAAVAILDGGKKFMNVLPCPGPAIGVEDLAEAIRLASAFAQDPDQGFGAVQRWHVEPSQRGKREDYQCAECGELGCWGDCVDANYGDEGDEP